MNKTLLFVAFTAMFATVLAVDCPKDEDENSHATYFPHETECGKFYECDHGSPKEFNCSPGLYWDARLNICNTDVDCGDLQTSTAPPATTEASEYDSEEDFME